MLFFDMSKVSWKIGASLGSRYTVSSDGYSILRICTVRGVATKIYDCSNCSVSSVSYPMLISAFISVFALFTCRLVLIQKRARISIVL